MTTDATDATETTPTETQTGQAWFATTAAGGTALRAAGLDLLTALDPRLGRGLAGMFDSLDWAEQEITAAQSRSPRHRDVLFHSFSLLTPIHGRMQTEFVYRSHSRELLDRVVSGADTRAATAAEVCCAMLETSLAAPLRSSGVGLYARMWRAAGFPDFPELAELRVHHEALEQSVIDDHERYVREMLVVPSRHLRDVTCRGRHHGVPVRCTYAAPRQRAGHG